MAPPELLPLEVDAIISRVEHGFQGDVLPVEVASNIALIIGPYDGDDLDEAAALIDDGLLRLRKLALQEIPF